MSLQLTHPFLTMQLRRYLKSGRGGSKSKDSDAYRVVGGKNGFKKKDNKSYIIDFQDETPDETTPILWLVIDKDEEKVGKCVSAISEWALENYAMDLGVVDKEPKSDRLAPDDILVFLDKKPSADECQDIANEIANDPGFSQRKRGGLFDNGQQNIAVFDVSYDL